MPSMDGNSRVRNHRQRLRDSGLRPFQIWIPDVRRENFGDECRRQSQLISLIDHKNQELSMFIEEALDQIEGWEA
jgi:hypothetical protein